MEQGLEGYVLHYVKDGVFDVYSVYANGELANIYGDEDTALEAVDDLLELGVDAEMVITSVII